MRALISAIFGPRYTVGVPALGGLLVSALLGWTPVQAQVPGLINYQGQVTDAAGAPLATGTYTMHFRIFSVATGGSAIWGPQSFDGTAGTGKGAQVPVVDGFFNVILGPQDTTARNLTDAFGAADRYLEITVGANPPILPRQRILSAPYALKANQVADGSIVTASLADGAVTGGKIGGTTIGTSNLADSAVTSAKIADQTIVPADISSSHSLLNKTSGTIYELPSQGGSPPLRFHMAELNGVANANAVTLELPGNFTLGVWDALDVNSMLTARAGITLGNDTNISGINQLTGFNDLHLAGDSAGGTDLFISASGLVGVGTGANANSKLHVNGDGAQPSLRVQVNGASKLLVDVNGGVSVGANATPPGNGLYVEGASRLVGGVTGNLIATDLVQGSRVHAAQILATDNMLTCLKTDGSHGGFYSYGIELTWGNAHKPGGGSWAASSDLRLKKNVEPLAGSLDRLLELRSVSFEYIDPQAARGREGRQIGFIAQEVEKVFPDWVAEMPDGIKTVGPTGFEALAVQAFRELRAEKDAQIQTLENKVAQQEREIAELKAGLASRLAALEKMVQQPTALRVEGKGELP
jgi:hypothetical protein